MSKTAYIARLAAAAALSSSPLVLLAATPGHAAAACPVVTDKADILADDNVSLDYIPEAEIHVVAFDSVPGANIDKAVLDMRAACSDWQSASGGWGANDVVFAVSVQDRKTAIYYGPQFESHLGNDRYRSAMDAMNPRFADGDFTGGINAGIGAIADLLSSEPGTNTTVINNVDNSEPMDVPWGWVLGVPAGGAALFGAGLVSVRTRRRLVERTALRTEALTLTNEAASLFVTLDSQVKILDTSVTLLPQVDDDGINTIRADHAHAVETAKRATDAYLAHAETWTTTAIEDTDLTTAATARNESRNTKDAITVALAQIEAVNADITTLEERNAQTPRVLDTAVAKAAETLPVLDALDADGYQTATLRTRVVDLEALIDEAHSEHGENLWSEAADLAAIADEQSKAIYAEATGMRERRAAIEADLEQASAKHVTLDAKRAQGASDLAALVGTFHSTDTDTITDSFRDGEQAYKQTVPALDTARIAVGMDQQRFDDAESAMRQAWDLLSTAEREFVRPAQQHSFLDRLTLDLAQHVASAHTEVTSLKQTITSNAEAMKYLDKQVDCEQLAKAVNRVLEDLGAERPPLTSLDDDLAAVRQDIRDERSRVDAIIREYAEAQRAIARAQQAVRDAEAKSSRSHAGARSKSLADDARRDLRSADNATSLALIISSANNAISTASQAESAAQSAINSYNASQSSSSYSSGGSSSFGGGGGSSDWGGGGSSSFDGGGGSSSW